MEAKSSDPENGEKSEFLSLFWRLAEFSDAERMQSATLVIKVLSDKQGKGKLPCEELNYAVKRLIRGLSSSRKCARLGFSMALTQVLRTFPSIVTSSVLETIKTELQLVGSDSKGEQREVILGRALAYMAIIQSDRVKSAPGEDLTAIIKGLLHLKKKRAPLHIFCTHAIVLLMEKISADDFNNYVWSSLEEGLTCGWSGATPDVLWLLLTAKTYHSQFVNKKFLLKNWGTQKILGEKMYQNLASVIKHSASDHPIIHPICPRLLQLSSENGTLASFWTSSIDGLSTSEKPNRKYMLLQLAPIALGCAKTVTDIEAILSHNLVSFMMNTLALKKHPLYAAYKQLSERIVSFAANCQSEDLKVAVVTSLVRSPGSVLFDSLTKTKTVHSILITFNTEATNLIIPMLQDIIRGEDMLSSNTDDVSSQDLELKQKSSNTVDVSSQDLELKQKWAISTMTTLAGVSAYTKGVPQLNILHFLLISAFFTIDTPDKENATPQLPPLLQCTKLFKKPVSLSVRHCLQEAFFKILDKLSTHRPGDKVSARDQRPFISTLSAVVQYAQVLLSKPELVSPVKPLSSDAKEAWEKVIEVTEKISAKHNKDEKMNEGHAFLLLFYLHGLQLFSDPTSALDVLTELHACYNKASAKKRRRSVAAHIETEPEWVDVITDLLLSLLSQDSHLVRMVVNNVFQMLCPQMTQKTLGLILAVLQPDNNEDEEGGTLGFEDDEEEEEEEEPVEDSEATSDGEKEAEEDMEESEESASSDDDIDEEEVDERYKASVKAALGNAAAMSDEDSDSSGVDDETMFKMDAALAAVFQTRKKSKKDEKERERQLMIYRKRALDLIDILVQNNRSPSILLALIQPLLDLLELCQKDKHMKDIGAKIGKTFTVVCKPGKLSPDPAVNKDDLPIRFRELIEYSKKVSGLPVMMTYVASACLLIVRVLLGLESDRCPSPVRTRSMAVVKPEKKKDQEEVEVSDNLSTIHTSLRDAIGDYCTKRDLSHIFLHTIMERQSTVMWPVGDILLERSVDTDTRVFCRSQICKMMASMITKQTVSDLSSGEWEPFAAGCMSQMCKVVLDVSDVEIRPKYLQEVTTVITHLLMTGDRQLYQNVDFDAIQEKLATLRPKVNHSKDTRKAFNKLISLLEKGQSKAKKDKRRKSDQPMKMEDQPSEVTPKKLKSQSLEGNGVCAIEQSEHNGSPMASDSESKLKKNKKRKSVGHGKQTRNEALCDSEVTDTDIKTCEENTKPSYQVNGMSSETYSKKGSPSPGKMRRKSLRSAVKIQ